MERAAKKRTFKIVSCYIYFAVYSSDIVDNNENLLYNIPVTKNKPQTAVPHRKWIKKRSV